jgi:drug/metabolite transporter (DMT)-like permease
MKTIFYHGLLFSFVLVTSFVDIGVKLAMEWFSPIASATLVSSIGALAALSVGLIKVRNTNPAVKLKFSRKIYLQLFLMSFLSGLALICSNTAIDLINPLTFRVTQVVFFPIFVSIISWRTSGKHTSQKELLATALAIFGFFVYYLNDLPQITVHMDGLLLSILAALLYATVLYFTKKLTSLEVPTEFVIAFRFFLLGLMAVFFVPEIPAQLPLQIGLLICGLGLVGYWLRYELMVEGIKGLPITAMSLYTVSTPVVSAILYRLFLKPDPYLPVQILGLSLIVIALFWSVAGISFPLAPIRSQPGRSTKYIKKD